jgi:hypothetical protein
MKAKIKAEFLPDRIERNRPNKTAKGMSATARRSGHRHTGDVLTLAVKGTAAKRPSVLGNFGYISRLFPAVIVDRKTVYKRELTAVGRTKYRLKYKKPLLYGCRYNWTTGARTFTVFNVATKEKIQDFEKLADAEKLFNELNSIKTN